MRWFKHMTASYDDQKLSLMVDELGMEGYGFWWRMLEVVARELEPGQEPACEYSLRKWGEFFGFSAKKFEKFAKIFQKFEIFQIIFSENGKNTVRVCIPNLLKYRDEYSERKARKSGQCPDSIGRKSAPNTDTEIDNINTHPLPLASEGSEDALPPSSGSRQEGTNTQAEGSNPRAQGENPRAQGSNPRKRKPTQYSAAFEAFWGYYPRKTGKDAAWKAWQRRSHELPGPDELAAILERQCHCEQWQRDGGQYIPHPATWLNQGRWKDGAETEQWTPKPANW